MPRGVYERTPEQINKMSIAQIKRRGNGRFDCCRICGRQEVPLMAGRCNRCRCYKIRTGVEWSLSVSTVLLKSKDIIKLKTELAAAQSEINRLTDEMGVQKALVAERDETIKEMNDELEARSLPRYTRD